MLHCTNAHTSLISLRVVYATLGCVRVAPTTERELYQHTSYRHADCQGADVLSLGFRVVYARAGSKHELYAKPHNPSSDDALALAGLEC